MKKRLFCIAVAVAMMTILSVISFKISKLAASPIVNDTFGKIATMNRCVCKQSACYGGNLLSIRQECYRGEAAVNCHDYDALCVD